jgi:hypothetical protein
MKLRTLKLIALALFTTSALIVLTHRSHASGSNGINQPPAVVPAVQGPAQSNIKVLQGVPEAQIGLIMDYFGASLGVRCNFCHVNKDGQWHFEADDKPEKTRAREMIKMTMAINKDSFNGNTTVSCYTCHRGRNNPVGVPQLPVPEATPRPNPPAQGGTTGQAPAPTADQVIEKYVAAIGGSAGWDKVKTRMMKGTATGSGGRSMTIEADKSGTDKFFLSFTMPQGTMERALTGSTGWEKGPQGARAMAGEQLAEMQEQTGILFFNIADVKKQFPRMGAPRKEKLDGHDVYVLRGGSPDGKRAQLFFDADTGLLRRVATATPTVVGLIPNQVDFDDYRDVEGVKVPFSIVISSADAGNPKMSITFSEVKVNGSLDDNKFNMPKSATP